jgi:phage gp46-like protein
MSRGIDAVLQELPGGTYDIKIGFDGDIETADSFDTYITVALLTDKRADASEMLDPLRRRGWVGNEHTPGFEMGSKLWLYEQARLTRTTINQVQTEAANALQSLVDENLAVAVRGAELILSDVGVTLEVDIERSPSRVAKRYFDLWQKTGVS